VCAVPNGTEHQFDTQPELADWFLPQHIVFGGCVQAIRNAVQGEVHRHINGIPRLKDGREWAIREAVGKLAACLNFPFDWSQPANLQSQAGALLDCYSLRATKAILGMARDFARQHDKKLLVVLFDPYRAMTEIKDTGKRYDQEIVDYLARETFNYFDMNEVQLRDFKNYRISYQDYMKQYFVGHYNPRGNHFFAYSIKDKVVEWLDPKPISYGKPDPKRIDFKGYLPDYH